MLALASLLPLAPALAPLPLAPADSVCGGLGLASPAPLSLVMRLWLPGGSNMLLLDCPIQACRLPEGPSMAIVGACQACRLLESSLLPGVGTEGLFAGRSVSGSSHSAELV